MRQRCGEDDLCVRVRAVTIRLAKCASPSCLPCTTVVCNYCTDFLVQVRPIWEIPPYTQAGYTDGAITHTLTFSGKSQGSVCGSGSISEVPTFTDLSAAFDLSGIMSNVVYCGARPLIYATESNDRTIWACDTSVDVSAVSVSVVGNSVTVSASTVTLPTLAYYGGSIPDDTNTTLSLVFSAIMDNVTRYVRVDLTWSWDGAYTQVYYYASDVCEVNTQTCLGFDGEGLRGYVDGLACAAFDPPTSCSTDEITAYTDEYNAAFILGGC